MLKKKTGLKTQFPLNILIFRFVKSLSLQSQSSKRQVFPPATEHKKEIEQYIDLDNS